MPSFTFDYTGACLFGSGRVIAIVSECKCLSQLLRTTGHRQVGREIASNGLPSGKGVTQEYFRPGTVHVVAPDTKYGNIACVGWRSG